MPKIFETLDIFVLRIYLIEGTLQLALSGTSLFYLYLTKCINKDSQISFSTKSEFLLARDVKSSLISEISGTVFQFRMAIFYQHILIEHNLKFH